MKKLYKCKGGGKIFKKYSVHLSVEFVKCKLILEKISLGIITQVSLSLNENNI